MYALLRRDYRELRLRYAIIDAYIKILIIDMTLRGAYFACLRCYNNACTRYRRILISILAQ